jgi:hypothetical protein
MIELMEHQLDAVNNLGNGKVLWGVTGSGKSAVVLEYYMRNEAPRPIIVITTAKKRDSLDWYGEAAKFGVSVEPQFSRAGAITVDSWNNIKNYRGVVGAFFVFDEQRVVGHGSWVKSFLKIAKKNKWVLLSATPGDTWLDYAPVFIANGYYTNITDFKLQHVVYEPFTTFPKVKMYLDESRLEKLRNDVLVEMPYQAYTKRVKNYMPVSYDKDLFDQVWDKRWHVYEDRPLKDAAERWRVGRRVVNSDQSRVEFIWDLIHKGVHDKVIVFYNFDYELEILRGLADMFVVAEWNGHRKNLVPDEGPWIYLVQYNSGAEGWNCTTANAMVFYSMTYSYRTFIQAQGRIDRLDTPFKTLYYYVLVADCITDKAVKRALDQKKNFNERRFVAENS